MADIRKVTENFSVAPQLRPEDMPELKAQGFERVIANRPDGEESGQPTLSEMKAAAKAAGLDWLAIPISGRPGEAEVEATIEALSGDARKTIAYCRSGTRSVTAWALAQVHSGAMPRDEVLAAALGAGYNLG